jgi:primosomal protein N' (replication factor Y) (superfamily II helicase)
VRVVPDVPAIHRRFDYAVPPALAAETRVGSRVRIDLHGRRVGAWVVEDDVEPTDGVTAKPLAGSSGLGPPPSVVALAEWAAWRWAGPLSSFLGTASPAMVVRAPAVGWPPTRPGAAAGGEGAPDLPRPASPGGGSVALVDAVLAAEGCAVVRLAPALDATLVALELIHRLGEEQTLVLAPSHARADQVASRLRGAGIPVAMLPDGWDRAATERGVVVGTRSAAWAPLGRLRAAIVLDAHDEAYREERAPTWSAVDVIRERGRRDRAVVALVTPCPPVAMSEGVAVVTTPRPVEWRGWALVEVVDRTADDPRTGLFSERLVRALRSALAEGGAPVVCILNRTGRIRLLACTQCGALTRCTRCGGPMAQPGVGSGLQCRRCDHARPAVCAACDSTRLKSLRIGVSRATEELSALTGVEAVEITGRSAADHGAGERLVVGTEAALHRVTRAGMVAFLDIDQHLLAPRFTAGEETFSLLARAARLVGTRDAGGRVLVQTRIPDHEVLRAAAQADPTVLAQPERALRVTLGLPPFGALAALRGPGAADYAGGLGEVAGVAVSSVEADRWLVTAADHQILCDGLASVPRPAGRLRVEVDPTDA